MDQDVNLLNEINSLKTALDKLIVEKKYNLSDPNIISLSQRIDYFINVYNHLGIYQILG